MSRCENLVITKGGVFVCFVPGSVQGKEEDIQRAGCGSILTPRCMEYCQYLAGVRDGSIDPANSPYGLRSKKRQIVETPSPNEGQS